MSTPFLHTATGAYDLPAIMRRAWVYVRNERARHVALGFAMSAAEALRFGLTKAWDEAKGARAIVVWRAEEAAAFAAAQADARSAEIFHLEGVRAAADGIDNTAAFLAERAAAEERLSALRAAA